MTTPTARARRIRRPLFALAVLLVSTCALLGVLAYSASAGSSSSAATQAGLSYARTEMVWLSGPSVVHTRTAQIGTLPSLLPSLAPPVLRQNVNTSDLIHRYGPHRNVEIIILAGMYNSLPPDEGVNIKGEVVVLVDPRTKKVLFLTD